MTTCTAVARLRRPPFGILCGTALFLMLCLGAATGCAPLAAVASAALGGDADAPTLDHTPYGGPEASPQNGRLDRTIPEALQLSDREITGECRTELARLEGESATDKDRDRPQQQTAPPASFRSCERRLICLPGMRAPVPMRLCRPPPREARLPADAQR